MQTGILIFILLYNSPNIISTFLFLERFGAVPVCIPATPVCFRKPVLAFVCYRFCFSVVCVHGLAKYE